MKCNSSFKTSKIRGKITLETAFSKSLFKVLKVTRRLFLELISCLLFKILYLENVARIIPKPYYIPGVLSQISQP